MKKDTGIPFPSKDKRYGRVWARMKKGATLEEALKGIECTPQDSPPQEPPVAPPKQIHHQPPPTDILPQNFIFRIPTTLIIDPTPTEKALDRIQERCKAVAESLNIKLDDVNPLEALWMICDMQRDTLGELQAIRKALEEKK